MPCPVKDFFLPEHIKNMKAIVKTTGCVLFNVLVMESDAVIYNEHIASVERKLLAYFPTCLVIRMNTEYNVILACVPYSLEPSTAKQTKEVWRQGLDDLLDKFAFKFHSTF